MGEDLAPHLVCGRPCVSLEEGMATYSSIKGFPGSSARKESACNAGDPGPIPGLGRPHAEGISYPLNSWASLMTQMVKNLPAVKETWVRSMGWEDPPWRRAWQHTPVFLPGESPWTEEPGRLQSMGLQRVEHN